ncbi:RluA family pseudouridine synthase [Mariprofundus sp. KV]|uniref:RluA family pseudouridine synthase n=1 Tax=Mariprofundus sp. KV TaxID=2608715 RepID=UPI0015A38E76|nr:RluA family pseudouridine synthase [Mariprofundus sp. KV]NWF37141.1 RluA family pseudouridine synthase [Mariprofundus sp. KV]
MMVTKSDNLVTWFPAPPETDEIPVVMPSPFANTPHPLAEQACRMLMQDLGTQKFALRDFSNHGKMFGVLVVRDKAGRIGYLSGFSGMINGLWQLPGFVPQLFELAEHESYLYAGNDQLAALTEQIDRLQCCEKRSKLMQEISSLQQQRDLALAALKQRHREAKALRKQQRLELLAMGDADAQQRQMRALALASQHHKREFTNASLQWQEKLQLLQQQLDEIDQQISDTRFQRSEKSRQLHNVLFATYRLHNFAGETQPITAFFDGLPPAGSGDCAGPKLVHYARKQRLQPIALGEFWWGASPSTGIRHHGHFYPACRGKCRKILPFMLHGLAVEPEPDFAEQIDACEPRIVYEDESLLVVNKPSGLMSAPGKLVQDSVYTRLLQRYPNNPELRLVHRLDMATSGLLLVAKNLLANKFLQRQFIQRSVEKRYEAILSRKLPPDQLEGEINLPLIVDLDDTPRQMVSHEHGKPAKTRWQVLGYEGETTRVWFYPLTGRTHQLRIHASHQDGLNAAIVGDALYGRSGDRLKLHAQRLCFNHPVTRERLEFEVPSPF